MYCIVGNFRGVQFSQWMVDFYYFTGLVFADAHTHAHYVLYNRAYFMCLIFAVRSMIICEKFNPSEISHYTVISSLNM